jgi:hypothetical protein
VAPDQPSFCGAAVASACGLIVVSTAGWNKVARSAVRKIAVVTQAGPNSGLAEVVRVCGLSDGVLLEFVFGSLSGIGVAGYDIELLCPAAGLPWYVGAGEVGPLGTAGVGEPIIGGDIPGAAIAGIPAGAVIAGCVTKLCAGAAELG